MSEKSTQTLAVYTTAAREVPEVVRHQAAMTFLNFVGCAVGGARHQAVDAAARALLPLSGSQAATVMGRGERADPLLAALLNGMSASVYSFDDTHAEAVVHPGGPVGSALLAFAEGQRVKGSDFLLAYALGSEVVCRVSKAVSVAPAVSEPGWIQTGIAGGIGAAAAVGKLLGLDATRMAAAMGIAACQASGLRSLSRSMCFSLMAGQAAQTGLRAALMAERGFTAADDVLEAPDGYLHMYSKAPHPAFVSDGLGEHFELLKNTFKPYPCGVVIHPAIDACLGFVEQGVAVDKIQTLVVKLDPASVKLASLAEPRTVQECQMSVQHWVAATLIDGQAGLAQGSAAKLNEPRIAALRSRVRLLGDKTLRRDAASLEMILTTGEVINMHIEHCRGSAARPMTQEDLVIKFRSQCHQTITVADTDQLLDSCQQLDSLADVSLITQAAAGVALN